MRKLKLALGGLAAFLAVPFLSQALIRLFYRFFPPNAPFPTWFDVEWYMVISLVMLVLTWAALTWLFVRKQGQTWRLQCTLTALATLFALPFLFIRPLQALHGLLYRLFPSTRSPFLWFGLAWYLLSSEWLLSDMTRYVTISLAALTLSSTALIWLLIRERSQVWQRGHFYVLLIALAAVLAFPFVMRYQPAVEAASGVEMHMVERPGLLEGAVKRCQVRAQVRRCLYEPLGWADAQTLVYRKWCGGHYTAEGWYPNSPGDPLAYHLATDAVAPFLGAPNVLSYETCNPAVCVSPALAGRKYFPPLHYLPGHFEDPIVSPDGGWVAFTARHVYGPEDLLIIPRE